ncbi:hypothetical protein TCON_1138 [Astathelohania contejeani]|uniref:Uncharacterized protein n=1 Tax=Astathelohania contejeani TaxID=164912 RepID=A0ABQ7HZS8_9MICR|nr:hypothetical protein TCON_1138 [Thelohania contejeani]
MLRFFYSKIKIIPMVSQALQDKITKIRKDIFKLKTSKYVFERQEWLFNVMEGYKELLNMIEDITVTLDRATLFSNKLCEIIKENQKIINDNKSFEIFDIIHHDRKHN